MRSVLFAALLVAGCGGKESKTDTAAPQPVVEAPRPALDAAAVAVVEPTPAPPRPPRDESGPPGHDFTPIGKALFVVGACGDGEPPPGFPAHVLESHCKAIDETQAEYQKDWLDAAKKFFADKIPSDIPKKVVYPFAGGDLSTALTVFPDADEITTLSLEPAGDPRTLETLGKSPKAPVEAKPAAKGAPKKGGMLAKALGTVRYELDFLYRVNFSNTMNMIEAMRGGALPTQLIFGLSALKVHGFELVSLRYFTLDDAGDIVYLTEAELNKAPPADKGRSDVRNRAFANAELRFRKPGGRIQIYRHLQVNLDDAHLTKDRRALLHLEAKGPIAGMTKAASYLLSWDSFAIIRQYLIDHVVWMVSDATGVAPKWGKRAGFEYETYGTFQGPHISAGNQIWKNWNAEFVAQTKRPLPFRFGYYDKKGANHLVIMRKKKA